MSDIKMNQKTISFAQTGSCFDATNTAGIKVRCEMMKKVNMLQLNRMNRVMNKILSLLDPTTM